LMLPAYLANSSAVVLGGGPPVDMGKEFGDARLLGDGKTWRGFFGGTLSGFVLAMIMNEVLVRGLLPESQPSQPSDSPPVRSSATWVLAFSRGARGANAVLLSPA